MTKKVISKAANRLGDIARILAYKLNCRLYRMVYGDPQAFLRKVKGVIHIGASTGQERNYYSMCGLNVLWIEAVPTIYSELQFNIQDVPYQKAVNYLVDESNRDLVPFNIASNSSESSSLLELGEHKAMYPDVHFIKTITLTSRTLDFIIIKEDLDLALYDSLVLDVQGAEMRVLKGASNTVSQMKYIQVEVSDFRAYKDCPILSEMTSFMSHLNFSLHYLQRVSFLPGVGTYYNATYVNSKLVPSA